MEHNNNEELNQLREFYKQYKNTESAYVQYVNLKKQLNDALRSIDRTIKENRSFGTWAIIIGVVTIPIIIGVFIVIAGIIALFVSSIQNKRREVCRRNWIVPFNDKINQVLGYLKQQYNNTNMCIAFDYASPFIVVKLIQYMECGRADTIKEALNIYENELAINVQQQQLQEIAKSSKATAIATTYMAYDTYISNLANVLK